MRTRNVLAIQFQFRSLSLRDLLDAREHYHVHLMNKANVVGTAVGLYLIRNSDPWPNAKEPDLDAKYKPKGERTLANSATRPYSWPCVIVLVNTWIDDEDFTGELHPEDMVPKTLYMPDGRMVPVCVVRVEPAAPASEKIASWAWPKGDIGGGFPLLVRSQGQLHRASVGCLVTDNHTVYALTNRHVCGPAGTPVYARLRDDEVEIGQASALQLSRVRFDEVYPSFPGARTFLNLDVGLVEVSDARDWTSSVYGLGEVGPLADLNEQNLGLQLIDHPVSAFGAASGHLEGRIKALFYRYKSVGGYDYVADMLIAPTDARHQTMPGDSGTVWHLKESITRAAPSKAGAEPSKKALAQYRPIAIEWGGQSLNVAGQTFNFALATNLSNVCKLLDVELVVGHNAAAQPYWGATGHYSIAHLAIPKVSDSRLKKLLAANAARLSFDRSQLEPGNISEVLKGQAFVPLADVPDVVWKKVAKQVKGGRDVSSNVGPEHPTHFCDIDETPPEGGPSLRDECMQDPTKVTVAFWRDFYTKLRHARSKERGCLPFRVWQFYDAMVDFVKAKDYTGYVTAAGLLAHYIGDACQPFHGSVLADGYKDRATQTTTSTGNSKLVWPAQGVHSAYETKMIDKKAAELFDAIATLLKKARPKLQPIRSGRDAAVATVKLMDDVAKILPPAVICDAYIELGEGESKPVIDGLWDRFDVKTARIMALGIRNLAHVWQSAWVAGGGSKAAVADLNVFSEAAIRKLYEEPTFVPSLDLDHIEQVLK